MSVKLLPFYLFCCILFFFSCEEENEPVPILRLLDVSAVEFLHQGQDSFFVKIGFKDNDGDLGNNFSDNIFIYDGRTDSLYASYQLPSFMQTSTGLIKEGEFRFKLYSPCCFQRLRPACDSISRNQVQAMTFKITMQDNAGNISQAIETDSIYLTCTH